VHTAQKPLFFTSETHFKSGDKILETNPSLPQFMLEIPFKVVSEGNKNVLTQHFKNLLGNNDAKTVFFAQNLFSDILPLNIDAKSWDVITVIQEMSFGD
jgi:hypothetical protein